MSRNGQWGTVEPEHAGEVLFEVKAWKDDAAPALVKLEGRVDELEGRFDRYERKLDRHFAKLAGIGWAVGIFWTVAVVLVGVWLAR